VLAFHQKGVCIDHSTLADPDTIVYKRMHAQRSAIANHGVIGFECAVF
jgi:hypothetical protein